MPRAMTTDELNNLEILSMECFERVARARRARVETFQAEFIETLKRPVRSRETIVQIEFCAADFCVTVEKNAK